MPTKDDNSHDGRFEAMRAVTLIRDGEVVTERPPDPLEIMRRIGLPPIAYERAETIAETQSELIELLEDQDAFNSGEGALKAAIECWHEAAHGWSDVEVALCHPDLGLVAEGPDSPARTLVLHRLVSRELPTLFCAIEKLQSQARDLVEAHGHLKRQAELPPSPATFREETFHASYERLRALAARVCVRRCSYRHPRPLPRRQARAARARRTRRTTRSRAPTRSPEADEEAHIAPETARRSPRSPLPQELPVLALASIAVRDQPDDVAGHRGRELDPACRRLAFELADLRAFAGAHCIRLGPRHLRWARPRANHP